MIEIIEKASQLEELTYRSLAVIANYSKEDLEWIDKFWNIRFDNSWIYISREVVVEWCGYKQSKDCIGDFIKKLTKSHEKNIDYKELKSDDELVKEYHKSLLGNISGQTKRGGHNQKHYAITGECLKDMMMSSETAIGKKIRKIYIKTQKLSQLMMDVINYKQIQEKEAIIAEQLRLLNIKNEDVYWQDKVRNNNVSLLKHDFNGTNAIYNSEPVDNSIKTGYTNAIQNSNKGKSKRESNLEAGTPPDGPFKMKKIYKLPDGFGKIAESIAHTIQKPLHMKTSTSSSNEWFLMHPIISEHILSKISKTINECCMLTNNYIDILEENNRNYATVEILLNDPEVLYRLNIDTYYDPDLEEIENLTNNYNDIIADEYIDGITNKIEQNRLRKRNEIIQKAHIQGFTLQSQYITTEHDLQIMCSKNHLKTIKPINIDIDNIYCAKCDNLNKSAELNKILYSKKIICIDYENNTFECLECEYKWNGDMGHLKREQSAGCPKCKGVAKITKQDLINVATENGGKWVESDVNGVNCLYNWICASGHTFKCNFTAARDRWGVQCDECKLKNIKLSEIIAQYEGAELLTKTELKTVNDSIHIKCPHKDWTTKVQKVILGKWNCNQCKRALEDKLELEIDDNDAEE